MSHAVEVADFTIRVASAPDHPVMAAVFRRASLGNEGDRALFDEHPEFLEWPTPEAGTLLFVAAADEMVIGFAAAAPDGRRLELVDLFVDPDWTRRGVARRLVSWVEDAGRRIGATQIRVDANDHALAFYRAAGFSGDERRPLEHGTATRMTRAIPGR